MKNQTGFKPPKKGKTYPFSSTRQALRSLRRAQGGPGLSEGPNPVARTVFYVDAGNMTPQILENIKNEIQRVA